MKLYRLLTEIAGECFNWIVRDVEINGSILKATKIGSDHRPPCDVSSYVPTYCEYEPTEITIVGAPIILSEYSGTPCTNACGYLRK